MCTLGLRVPTFLLLLANLFCSDCFLVLSLDQVGLELVAHVLAILFDGLALLQHES